MRTKRNILTLNVIFIVLSCSSYNLDIKNKEVINFLKDKKYEIKKSNYSGNYLYIYSLNNNERNNYKNLIKEDIIVNNKVFKINENNWFFIYDKKQEKIIIKNEIDFGPFNGAGQFIDSEEFIFFNCGTYVDRHIYFYNLKNYNLKPIKIISIAGMIENNQTYPRDLFLLSNDNRYVAFMNYLDENMLDSSNLQEIVEVIRIVNLENGKEILIQPEINSTIKLVEWIDNNRIKYIVKENQNIKKKEYKIP